MADIISWCVSGPRESNDDGHHSVFRTGCMDLFETIYMCCVTALKPIWKAFLLTLVLLNADM